jgi:nicotinamide-nucleotide amidase
MKIELVNTGTELLLGDTVNTNAAWLGQQLAAHGMAVSRQTIVPDGPVIQEAILEAASRADVVIVTGGLGPTNDDLSRESAAAVLGLDLAIDEAALQTLEAYFEKRGKVMSVVNRKQAMKPVGSEIMENPHGTAPGVYLPPSLGAARSLSCAIFLTPGPPREFKPMIEQQVIPRLVKLYPELADREVLYLKVTGMGESEIVDKVERDLEAVAGLELGYCLGKGDVDVRLSGRADAIQAGREIVVGRIGDFVVSEDRRLLEQVVVDDLKAAGRQVAVAESCTGGAIASRLTDVSGASSVFGFGYVTYANEAKQKELGVPLEMLEQHGAVSAEVAGCMAEGCLQASGAHFALAVTGIAGPTGGTAEKPVGLVYVALAETGKLTETRKLFFPGGRDRFKMLTSQFALEMLRRRLAGLPLPP